MFAKTDTRDGVALRNVGVGAGFVAAARFAALHREVVVVRCARIALVAGHAGFALTLAFCVALKAAGT